MGRPGRTRESGLFPAYTQHILGSFSRHTHPLMANDKQRVLSDLLIADSPVVQLVFSRRRSPPRTQRVTFFIFFPPSLIRRHNKMPMPSFSRRRALYPYSPPLFPTTWPDKHFFLFVSTYADASALLCQQGRRRIGSIALFFFLALLPRVGRGAISMEWRRLAYTSTSNVHALLSSQFGLRVEDGESDFIHSSLGAEANIPPEPDIRIPSRRESAIDRMMPARDLLSHL
ncbi:hypothetical protein A7U60_g7488 [Sanghuangporus baumii]|uniref:Uncharacterized protein n=1 Tax=Sanghuangporus baumii TaxID=108892 RepID=A0A9Q5HT50_SANBA|nr:hypothetical protein A7U60_g7488 [Sanghuangporus baumii]